MSDIAPTKTHTGENFPVASVLIAPRHRGTVLAFYRFARAADDVADHPALPEADKLARLDRLEESLLGRHDLAADALPLRAALAERALSPRHAQDLLTAFRMDVTKRRYADWAELMHYCSYSANPVGRFVLDVHGESRASWPANDALCSALQVINHLQDCQKDYRALDRVYVPLDALARHGLTVEALDVPQASPALRECLRELAARTGLLLDGAATFAGEIADRRLGLEVAVIYRLARTLVGMLERRDPLSERVHLGKAAVARITLAAAAAETLRRAFRHKPATRRTAQDA